MGLSSAALGAVIGVLTDGRDLAVRLSHECLQFFFKQLVGGFGCGRRCGSGAGRTVLGCGSATLCLAVGTRAIAGAEMIATLGTRTVAAGSLGLGLQTLDGQIDLVALYANDHYLHILTFGQMLTDVTDIRIGHFGNMYHAGVIFRKRDERTEIGDRFYLAF